MWDKQGEGKCHGFPGKHTRKSRVYLLQLVGDIRHRPCCVPASLRGKNTPHLSPSDLWGHHFHLLNAPATQPASSVVSLCKSPNMQNTITPSKQHHEGHSKDLLKPVRNVPVGGRKTWNCGEKRIAVAYEELRQCREMGARKCCWSSIAVGRPAKAGVVGQAAGEAKPWWCVRDGV